MTATAPSQTRRVLVIEDDAAVSDFLRRGLTYEGFLVSAARDGAQGLIMAESEPPDIVILDVMLPGIDGTEVCRRLKAAHDVPVLILTARDAVADRVRGLDAGADDYLVKPFAFEELLARMRALMRRSGLPPAHRTLQYADLSLDMGSRAAWRGTRPVQLSTTEFKLLSLFMQSPELVLTRNQIMDRVWGYDFGGESNVLEVYIRYLRTKLEAEGEPRLLHTVRGAGYVLRS
ncbi:MAG: response regulator transcription factor [Chloroflexi bacterium]|nr:response regulator transcription factor [Chloroflexota bacterium]